MMRADLIVHFLSLLLCIRLHGTVAAVFMQTCILLVESGWPKSSRPQSLFRERKTVSTLLHGPPVLQLETSRQQSETATASRQKCLLTVKVVMSLFEGGLQVGAKPENGSFDLCVALLAQFVLHLHRAAGETLRTHFQGGSCNTPDSTVGSVNH
ncbi:hypothetical protein XENOCAPTIV_029701 [Xenoophorus captivus]|uniref:Secreted protein n=1 Tax=Xenoophorus captivus TaxID=1517983 RepID=A0ABV0QF63_9TELE